MVFRLDDAPCQTLPIPDLNFKLECFIKAADNFSQYTPFSNAGSFYTKGGQSQHTGYVAAQSM